MCVSAMGRSPLATNPLARSLISLLSSSSSASSSPSCVPASPAAVDPPGRRALISSSISDGSSYSSACVSSQVCAAVVRLRFCSLNDCDASSADGATAFRARATAAAANPFFSRTTAVLRSTSAGSTPPAPVGFAGASSSLVRFDSGCCCRCASSSAAAGAASFAAAASRSRTFFPPLGPVPMVLRDRAPRWAAVDATEGEASRRGEWRPPYERRLSRDCSETNLMI